MKKTKGGFSIIKINVGEGSKNINCPLVSFLVDKIVKNKQSPLKNVKFAYRCIDRLC